MPPPPLTSRREAMRVGIRDVAPMLLGVAPFGLVAGAAPVAGGLDVIDAIGFSVFVFAGASQLAAIDLLTGAGESGVLIVAVTVWTINLRLVLYSASLAPFVQHEPLRRRLAAGIVLVDQNYAFSVSRWPHDPPELRLPYYFAQGALLWVVWQIATVLGAVLGAYVPDSVPLTFALPLVFLVLLMPTLVGRPSVIAAVTGGVAAVAAAELGATNLAIAIGCIAGITAGTTAAAIAERDEAAA